MVHVTPAGPQRQLVAEFQEGAGSRTALHGGPCQRVRNPDRGAPGLTQPQPNPVGVSGGALASSPALARICVCISWHSPEKQNQFLYFQELAHATMEPWQVQKNPEGADQQAGDSRKSRYCVSSPGANGWQTPSCSVRSLCVLVRPSADWTRPNHTMEGNLIHSKFTDIKVSLIHKTLPQKHSE